MLCASSTTTKSAPIHQSRDPACDAIESTSFFPIPVPIFDEAVELGIAIGESAEGGPASVACAVVSFGAGAAGAFVGTTVGGVVGGYLLGWAASEAASNLCNDAIGPARPSPESCFPSPRQDQIEEENLLDQEILNETVGLESDNCPLGFSASPGNGLCLNADGCPPEAPYLSDNFFCNQCPAGQVLSNSGCIDDPYACPPGFDFNFASNDCRNDAGCSVIFPYPVENCCLTSPGGCDSGEVLVDCQCVPGSNMNCGDGVCDAAAGELDGCPQDCPMDCGDGICNASFGEIQSCPGDCPQNQCCVDTDGCPSEELYTCPGDCCCCHSGARCVNPNGFWTCGF
jgi:hypothetical protein